LADETESPALKALLDLQTQLNVPALTPGQIHAALVTLVAEAIEIRRETDALGATDFTEVFNQAKN
jgi:hypothetical protein